MSESLLTDLLEDLPYLQSQAYFKSSLTALSHALEDLVIAAEDSPLVIANFQQERFYRQESRRYQQISQRSNQVYVLAAPDSELGFARKAVAYEMVPLEANDELTKQWHLVIVGKRYSACLICVEKPESSATTEVSIDPMRHFEGFWSFDRQASVCAARLLLGRIVTYRPELREKIEQAWQQYGLTVGTEDQVSIPSIQSADAVVFGQRLVHYLQSGQDQLLSAYQTIQTQEKRERLINTITTTIRNSLNPRAVLATTVQALGQTFPHCRCLIYCCRPTDRQVVIEYESVDLALPALQGERWSLAENALIQVAMSQNRAIAIADVTKAPYLQQNLALQATTQRLQIRAYLLVPIRYQGALLGMIELHQGQTQTHGWSENDISLVEAIATQAGFALIQAQTCADLEALNGQLKAIERSQRNLIGIVGHELRTPLSTIQICLETIESEPDMPAEFLQTMLDTALTDSERMRKLVQNFLTLSRLETGTENLSLESIQIPEVVTLALNSIQSSLAREGLPKITVALPPELPTVRADGERLVKVLTELLENACKFTAPEDEITIQAQVRTDLQTNEAMSARAGEVFQGNRTFLDEPMVEVIVTDTGRGVEPSQVEAIFEWFSQEEDFLRRTVGGVGLGLAICRQLIQGMGGTVWAESAGKNRGSKFHFTVPIELTTSPYNFLPA
jgi:DICT domain-containing protein/signal transduction histidine kinase